MPATLTAERVVSVPELSASVAEVGLSDLDGMERAVALYASDMPTRYVYRSADGPEIAAWIVQGVHRLGLAEVRLLASYMLGHRLLWLHDLTTAEQERRHAGRFPSKSRLDRAERLATVSIMNIEGLSEAARTAVSMPLVDGPCVCKETGWIPTNVPGTDVGCPAHNRTHALPFGQTRGVMA